MRPLAPLALLPLLALCLPPAAADGLPPVLEDPPLADPDLFALVQAITDRSLEYLNDFDPNDNSSVVQEGLQDYLADLGGVILGSWSSMSLPILGICGTSLVFSVDNYIDVRKIVGVAQDDTMIMDDGRVIPGHGFPLPGYWKRQESGPCPMR